MSRTPFSNVNNIKRNVLTIHVHTLTFVRRVTPFPLANHMYFFVLTLRIAYTLNSNDQVTTLITMCFVVLN